MIKIQSVFICRFLIFSKSYEYKIAQFKNAHKVFNSLKNGIIVTNENSIINVLPSLCFIIS